MNIVLGIVIVLFILQMVLIANYFLRKLASKPECTCLSYLGDNGPCEIHGNPHPVS
jgi:hypothetical protein